MTVSNSAPIPADAANRIKLVIFDVDGVLTESGIFVGSTMAGEPLELKRFDIQDGLGIKMLIRAGLKVVLVTGRPSKATSIRALELGVQCHQVVDAKKLPIVKDLIQKHAVGWEEVAMLADDIPDLAVLRRVGLKAAVSNATEPVLDIADWVALRPGGRGAAREFCDALLSARSQLDDVIETYVEERSRP